MLALGYDQYGKLSVGIRLVDVVIIAIAVAQGGDWGSRVSPWLYWKHSGAHPGPDHARNVEGLR